MRLGVGGHKTSPTRAQRSAVGMRRIDWVRLTVGDGPTVAEAVGVVHRRPTTRPLPLPLAARLTADGVPFVVHHHNGRPSSNSNGAA